ncbi:hypothetical protein HNV10_05230 [Winogradskyella litoriviva]|uniref:Uncharacterized protein n=1 Tax=Winogradskyella litoriviva TaxID=1220182 RepID=A0ABX2E2I0_9FLAO|nr:hypothetical protein [Winogradskyella litoriviva]NRD22632.1 hypothetical protein [Winogradskyella litoriviva]
MKVNVYIVLVFLTSLILFNSAKASLTYAYFELDPIGFIDRLCENKDKPELQCNGKCHLKKVAESQDKQQTTPESIVDFKELILYPSPSSDFELPIKIFLEKQEQIAYQNLYSFHNSNNCFHPPRV